MFLFMAANIRLWECIDLSRVITLAFGSVTLTCVKIGQPSIIFALILSPDQLNGGGRNITNEQKCGQQLENWNGWNPSCLFIVLNGTIPEKRKMEKKISTHINKYWEGR